MPRGLNLDYYYLSLTCYMYFPWTNHNLKSYSPCTVHVPFSIMMQTLEFHGLSWFESKIGLLWVSAGSCSFPENLLSPSEEDSSSIMKSFSHISCITSLGISIMCIMHYAHVTSVAKILKTLSKRIDLVIPPTLPLLLPLMQCWSPQAFNHL